MIAGKYNLSYVSSLIILSWFLCMPFVHAQINNYHALDSKFKEYEILSLDSKSIYNDIKSSKNLSNFIITLESGAEWNLNLRPSGIISSDYKVVSKDESGVKVKHGTTAIPMIGTINGVANSEVALTFNENFVYGFLRIGFEEYYIEPVNHLVSEKTTDAFILYNKRDIIENAIYKCGYENDKSEIEKIKKQLEGAQGNRLAGQCYTIRYNTASDWAMRVKYGNNTGVENHNIGVMNNVQTNYDNEFADEIQFVMGEQWISACSTCDPWSNSTDAGTLLDDFTNWGPSGFSATHDLAGLWTARDFNGGTVGIAWLGVLCTNSKYHCLQDFTSNATSLRVMTAHEIGHNFNAQHDASGSNTIMAPSVNSSTTWSSASISAIQGEYSSASCLQHCTGSAAPVASFTYNINSFCLPAQVQYFDFSSNANTRLWSFPGGSPATSTALNPVVTYNSPGTYNATLTVTNSLGNNSTTINNVISVIGYPFSDFTKTISGRTASFSYTGSYSQSYFWEFGDGEISTEINPVHTYSNDGTYNVTLTVTNDCGTDIETKPIVIATPPIANFTSNVVSGCQPLTVTFTNSSSDNATSYQWTFPGGTPSSSTLINPVVVYMNPGTFSVTLKAINSVGNNIKVKTNYVQINPVPVSSFTFAASAGTVTFTNNTQNATSFSWNFGDGNTSTSPNPIHTYTSNGIFSVVLSATNDCGTVTSTQQVTINEAPIAYFSPASAVAVCSGQSVTFSSTSWYNPTSFSWSFEGGNPSTSTDPNPVVTYQAAGMYDVQLIVSNGNGTAQKVVLDMISVQAKPTVSFTHTGDGLSLAFAGNILNGTGNFWDFGDGQGSNEMNPTHVFTSEGNYMVKLSAQNDCGTTVDSQLVQVQIIPSAGFIANQTSVCTSAVIHFTSQSSPSVTGWLWTFEGGTPSTSTEQNPSVSYASSGNYSVSLMVSNNAGTGTVMINDYIHVNTIPTTGFQTNINSNIVVLTNSGTGALTTIWDIQGQGDTLQLEGNTVIFIAPANGIYTITQTNINECGESVLNSQIITVNAYAVAGYALAAGSEPCEGGEITFSNQSVNATEYQWFFPGGMPASSTETNPTVFYSQAGVYQIRLLSGNNIGSDTIESSITIGSAPNSGFSYNVVSGNVNFVFTGNNTTSFKWEFGDGTISTDMNPQHTYTAGGNYLVKQISFNSCGQDTTSSTVQIVISSSVDPILNKNILIAPNPNYGNFTLMLQNVRYDNYKIELLDLYGRILDKRLVAINEQNSTIDMNKSDLPPGNYFVRISGSRGSAIRQIIIQR